MTIRFTLHILQIRVIVLFLSSQTVRLFSSSSFSCSALRSSLHAIGHDVDWRKISYPVTRELFIHIRDTVGQLLRFYLRSVLKLAGICNDPPLNENGKLQWLAF